jgi:hypothetical protein
MAILKNYEGLGKGEKVISKEEFEKRQREKMLSKDPVSVKKDGDVTSYLYEKPKVVPAPQSKPEKVITAKEFKRKVADKEIESTASQVKKKGNMTAYTYKKRKKSV